MKRRVLTLLLALAMIAAYSVPALNPDLESYAYSSKTADQAIDWVKSQLGKGIDYDGSYGCQCVDLILAYYHALGVATSSGNGKDYATNALPSGWSRVQNGTPKKGDILVYGASSSNPYGHVAIYESDYVTYHQNYNSHSYVEKVTTVKYNGFGNPYWGYIRPDWQDPYVDLGASFYANLGVYSKANGAYMSMGINPDTYNVGFVGGKDPTTSEGRVQSDSYKTRFWHYQRNSDGSYRISSCVYKYRNCYLTAEGTADGSNVKVVEGFSNSNNKQKWFVYGSNGNYAFRNAASDYVLWYNESCNLQIRVKNSTYADNEKVSLYRFEPITGSTSMTVNATTEDSDTVFNWTKPGGNVAWYNIKISRVDSSGTEVENFNQMNMLADNTTSSFTKTLRLPAGNYKAKEIAHSWVNFLETEEITFTVAAAATCAHSNTELRNKVDATCTSAGYSGDRYCLDCNKKLSTGSTVPATGHSWSSSFTVDTAATCTTAGSKSKHCVNCDAKSEVTEIPATGHNFGAWETIDTGGCDAGGARQHTCSTCGFIETESLNPSGHDWDTQYTTDLAPTCTSAGSESIHCKKCSATKNSRVVPALGHSYGDWVVTQAATCTDAGSKHRECSVCHDVINAQIPAAGHQWSSEYTVDTEATCQQEGSKSYHCVVCDEIKPGSSVVIAKGAHKYGSWTITQAATCTRDGSQTRECTLCGETQTQEIAASGHDWNNGKITEKPTCTEDGIRTYTCLTCGDEWDDFIPASGHRWDEALTVDQPATCTQVGVQSIHCSVCEKIKAGSQEMIPMKAHSFSSVEVIKEPTCSEPGQQRGFCTTCNNLVTAEIPTVAHTWNKEYTVDKEATYEAEGEKSIHCSVCDAVKDGSQETIPMLTVKATKLLKLVKGKRAMTVKWKKVSGINGYEIQYALNKKFTKSKKTAKVKKAKIVSKKLTRLKARKKYYVRVRTYKTVNGKKYYSKWSNVKSVKVR